MKMLMIKLFVDFLTFAQCSNAHGTCFKQSEVSLIVPIVKGASNLHERNRLIKFETLESSNASHTFSIIEKRDYLHIDERSGELWFIRSKWDVSNVKETSEKIVIELHVNGTEKASTSVTLNFAPYSSVKDFCEHQMCFYHQITFNTFEDFGESFKTKEIGKLAPKFHHRICKDFHVDYKLINGTNMLSLKGNKIYSNAPLNHEQHSSIKVNVQCHLKSTKSQLSQYKYKVYNVTILDVNVNVIRLQGNRTINVALDSPYFQKDTHLNERVIFLDNDTHDANSDIEFRLLNDTLGLFELSCHCLKHPGKSSTVCYCSLAFAKQGHFTISPYCVVLQAREQLRKKAHTEQSTICINSDISKVHEMLPKPERRQDNQNAKKGSTPSFSASTLKPADLSTKGSQLIIEYLSEVTVLQNASFLARVAEPLEKLNDPKINFNITHDPTDAFNVTKTAGIIFVQNVSNLVDAALNTPFELIVKSNKGKEYTIKITILEAERNCSEEDAYELCSRHEFQDDCEKACGTGSKNGRCKWRPMQEDGGFDNRSKIYNTCVPDLDKCPNFECDALEKFAVKLSEEENHPYYICSQDCTRNVHGSTRIGKQGIGRVTLGHMCSCFDDGNCQCDPGHKTTTLMTTITSEPENITNELSVGRKFFSTHPECGVACVMVMIGCPALLVFMAIFFFTLRRYQVKKMKKRMQLNGSTVSYRDSNDTEIININIINEMAKENYFQTYQKFDFDAKWEFDRMKLILDATLGEGEFGKVMKAYASDLDGPNTLKTVAVKTVKTQHSSMELLALLSEFQLLQEVSHPNVIKLLGACIRGEPPLIIIEYCCYGSLRSYLRLSRKLDESGDLEIEGVEQVTAKDVLSFLWQICKGMAYLAEIKLVHRDLALRNVLLAENKVCKISDFGLTRDVYEDDAYLKKSKDRVPVKWMAPESLADHVYTTKTDVWSFGVVGWEIITLGSTPYPGIPPQNLYHLLRNGHRMQRPENCSPEIYSLLEACWDENPNLRPSFKVLAAQFEKLLGTCAKYLEVDVVDTATSISNPLYISSNESESTSKDEINTKRIESLWTIPKFNSDVSKVDHKKYLLKYDDQLQHLIARYDKPKSLNERKSTNQKLRYQNDFHTFMKPNRYVNVSQPDLSSLCEGTESIKSQYDTPSMKKIRSYIEMRNIARARRSSISTTNDSFDDNNNEMPCKRTTINENLNFNDLDKLLKADKEISFKFSSLNNLNQRMTKTNETKC